MNKLLYVLDTSVLLHDSSALLQFGRHDVMVPMAVLEELDKLKRGSSEVAHNARQVSRFLDQLLHSHCTDLVQGIPLASQQTTAQGRLFFGATQPKDRAAAPNQDNAILQTAESLAKQRPVTLVSKDINLRIKAMVSGLPAEDYRRDQTLTSGDMLYRGIFEQPEDFWQQLGDQLHYCQQKNYYTMPREKAGDWFPHAVVIEGTTGWPLVVQTINDQQVTLKPVADHQQQDVWGIRPRNQEQQFALHLLMDPNVELVTLLGAAGTGKTLLALAAGLQQVLNDKRYRDIVITRNTVAVGEDIGYLPGSEEEKMQPWMGAFLDNLEFLGSGHDNSWQRQASEDILLSKVKMRSLNYMRGRTFHKRFVIIDEAQNMTAGQLKTLITRAGAGAKVVCLGNVDQIDTPYLSQSTSGLSYLVERFKACTFSGHITLMQGERSRLAEYANHHL